MPRKTLQTLSEPMFYVLMALRHEAMCGSEIVQWIDRKTSHRVALGPGTLYTILPKLTETGMIRETVSDGRKRVYELSEQGLSFYTAECRRLRQCVADMDDSPFADGRKEACHG